MTTNQTPLEKYEASAQGIETLAKFKPNEGGLWLVTGASDDSGYRKTLGYFSGRFSDVLDLAFTLPGFWGYGPGQIDKIEYQEVNIHTTAKRLALLKRQSELNSELNQVEQDLRNWS